MLQMFKMAPVYVAGRLLLSLCTVLLSLLTLVMVQIKSPLVYDRQLLLDLRPSVWDISAPDYGGQKTLPQLLSDIPAHLCRAVGPPPQRKRLWRRGKRGGCLVRLKICLAHSSSISRTGGGFSFPFAVHRRFLDPIASCLLSVTGFEEGLRPPRPCPPRFSRREVETRSLKTLPRAPRFAEPLVLAPARIGLVNARSLANKTFILKDFFSSRELDFLCVTETWIGVDEFSTLIELSPLHCALFNSPRTLGHGGGTAAVYKNDFKCKQCAVCSSFSSFEVILFEVRRADLLLCAVVYRPTKYHKNFLNDFSDFLTWIMPLYDRVLLVGDFNIHVCCPDKPLVKEFLSLIDSFNFVQVCVWFHT